MVIVRARTVRFVDTVCRYMSVNRGGTSANRVGKTLVRGVILDHAHAGFDPQACVEEKCLIGHNRLSINTHCTEPGAHAYTV
jgi:hypothetical protein